MQARPHQRPHLERTPSDGLARAAGEYTPEVSPLDQFINRGRQLKKELQNTEPNKQSHLSPYSRVGNPFIDEPDPQDGPRRRPSLDRKMPEYPRFSTITNDSFGDRDSMYSNDRDSTILGAFSFGFNPKTAPPDVQMAPKTVIHEFHSGRQSVRPTISHTQLEDEVEQKPEPQVTRHQHTEAITGDTRGLAKSKPPPLEEERSLPTPITFFTPPTPKASRNPEHFPSQVDRSEIRTGSPSDPSKSLSAISRSQSQPPIHRQVFPPIRKGSNGDRHPPRIDSAYDRKQYPPRSDSQTPSPTNLGFPMRKGSGDSARFPPPTRMGSNNGLLQFRPPPRELDKKYQPSSRRDSDASESKYIPYRQELGDSSLSRQESRNDRVLDPNMHSLNVMPENLGIRIPSPDNMGRDSPPGQNNRVPSPSSYSPTPWMIERSPSAASDVNSIYSVGGTRSTRPSFNFSRPMSSRPSIDSQTRPSIDIPAHLRPGQANDESMLTPVSSTEEPGEMSDNQGGLANSYIYTKFDLPRGRSLERESLVFDDSGSPIQAHHNRAPTQNQQPQNQPQNSNTQGNKPILSQSPPKNQPSKNQNMNFPPNPQHVQASSSGQHLSPHSLSPISPRPSIAPPPSNRQFSGPSKSTTPTFGPPKSPRLHAAPAANISPDEHLEIGIDLHEKGSLQESTYHLRCAAHGGHPTGMLLYALACRHGWGMRPNQKEGVSWLKKVTQLASSEVADDEKGVTKVAFIEKQGRRAQFALSIYELGVSHLNGWGTELDKGLALNCFEIAGKWGDPDALSEAGFCYANGVGTKKDLKKAAKFYRMAEAKGVNMVGNSWIWKDKYLDNEDRAALKLKKEGGGGSGSLSGSVSGATAAAQAKKDGGLFSRK